MNKKLPMQGIVPGDIAGTSKRYRSFRLVGKFEEIMFPICRTILGADGSVYFIMAMGNDTIGKVGAASLNNGTISFDSSLSLEDIPSEERRNTHISLHPTGRCHIRATEAQPISQHNLEGWFPVQREFDWIHAYSGPIGSLPQVDKLGKRDAVMPLSSIDISARLHVSIHPRTADCSVPLVNERIYTFAGISPHHIVRISVDEHPAVIPTIVIRESLQEVAKHVENA